MERTEFVAFTAVSVGTWGRFAGHGWAGRDSCVLSCARGWHTSEV